MLKATREITTTQVIFTIFFCFVITNMIPNNIRKRKGENASVFPIVLGVLVLGVLAFLVITNWRISSKRSELNDQIAAKQAEIKVVEEKIAKLKEAQTQAQTQDYQEQVARNDMGLQKPGEEVVAINKPDTPTTTQAQPTESFWQKIWSRMKF